MQSININSNINININKNIQKFLNAIFILGSVFLTACSTIPDDQPMQNQNTFSMLQSSQSNHGLVSELPKNNANISSIFYDSYSSSPIDADNLEKILIKEAARLKGNSKQAIKIVGYTDDEGSSSYNLALAQQRIDFVAEKLRKMGVNWQQIQRYPVGAEKSHCGEDTTCKKLMRRVDLIPLSY